MSQCRGITQQNRRCLNPGPYGGYCHHHVDQANEDRGYSGVPNYGQPYREVDYAEQLVRRVKVAEAEVADLRNRLGEAVRSRDAYQINCEAAKVQASRLQNEVQALEKGMAVLKNGAIELTRRVQDKASELAIAERDLAEARKGFTEVVQKVQAAESLRTAAEQELQRNLLKLQTNERELTAAREQLNKLLQPTQAPDKAALTKVQQQNLALDIQNSSLAADVKQSKLLIAQLQEKEALLTRQLSETGTDLETSLQAVNAGRLEVSRLSEQLTTAASIASQLRGELAVCKAQSDQAILEKDKLTAENMQLRAASLNMQSHLIHEASKLSAAPGMKIVGLLKMKLQMPLIAGMRHPTVKYHDDDILDYNDIINSIFYDPGRRNQGEQANLDKSIPTLMSLRAKSELLANERETILVDPIADEELCSFQTEVDEALLPCKTVQDRARTLAEMISTRLGGTIKRNPKIQAKSSEHIQGFHASVISLGAIKLGVCR
ncbi:hypothetical protein MMC07_006821 [Pseudocyphellaria aurata]|nr:hypothetical protein [Pseudocyphellaria aurata]